MPVCAFTKWSACSSRPCLWSMLFTLPIWQVKNNYSELVSFVFLLLWVRLSILSCVCISFPVNGFCLFAHFSFRLLVFFSWFLGALSIVKRLFAQNDIFFLCFFWLCLWWVFWCVCFIWSHVEVFFLFYVTLSRFFFMAYAFWIIVKSFFLKCFKNKCRINWVYLFYVFS